MNDRQLRKSGEAEQGAELREAAPLIIFWWGIFKA